MHWAGKTSTAANLAAVVSFNAQSLGAEDEIRTRDLLLGKEMLYH